MTGNNMHNLTTLIKRLEAATSRLEDIAQSAYDNPTTQNGASNSDSSVANAAVSSGQPTQPAQPSPAKPVAAPLPPTVEAFDALISKEIKTFLDLSNDLGGLVAQQAAKVSRAFEAERRFLIVTTRAKRPDVSSPAYLETLQELQTVIEAVNEVKLANRGSEFFIHLSMVSEGVPMVGWVTIDRKPQDFVTEMYNGAQFYGNKVLKEYKEKDPKHVEWVRSFYAIHKALAAYVEEHYPQGVTWNNKDGIDASEAVRQVNAEESGASATPTPSAAPAAPGPPPPPPPPPPPTLLPPAPDMNAVFHQISQGEDVTKGLKKVDASQMTHKNPALRAGATVPPQRSGSLNSDTSSARGKSPAPARKPQSLRTKKPPRKELDGGKKWVLENFDNPPEGMIEIEANMSQSVLISRCTKTAIRVAGKANAVSVDSSSALSLVVDSLLSSVEVIKVPKFEMQVLGHVPTIILDQVDDATIYLGRESLGARIFTSKCTGVNINVPGASDDDDYIECPVPEQIKTVIKDGKAYSEIVQHAG